MPIAEVLGAHLARHFAEVDPKTGTVRLDLFRIWRHLDFILSRRTRLVFGLVGVVELGHAPPPHWLRRRRAVEDPLRDLDPEEDEDFLDGARQAAQLWMSHVLERALLPGRERKAPAASSVLPGPLPGMGAGHRLLAALHARGIGYERGQLLRAHQRPGHGEPPEVLRGQCCYLTLRRRNLADHAPFSKPRREQGPLWLAADGAAYEVPEPFSIADALKSAPREIQPFLKAESLEALADLTASVIHTANKPWEYLKALGLPPPDWMGNETWEDGARAVTPSTNQARLTVRLRNTAFEIAKAAGRSLPVRADFEKAWAIHPVSQGKTPPPFASFAESPFGRAVIAQVGAPRSVEYLEALEDPEDPRAPRPSKALRDAQLELGGRDPEEILIEAEEQITAKTRDVTLQIVALLLRRGTIDELDRQIAEHLLAHRPVMTLYESDPALQARFPTEAIFRDHAFQLDEHIQAAIAALLCRSTQDTGAEGETA